MAQRWLNVNDVDIKIFPLLKETIYMYIIPSRTISFPQAVRSCYRRVSGDGVMMSNRDTGIAGTAGVGWSSRGSKVCVTMLALQCQC